MLKIIKFVKERFEVMGALKEIQPIKTGLKGEILIPEINQYHIAV